MADQGFVGLDESVALPATPPVARPNPTDVDLTYAPQPQPLLPRPVDEPSWISHFFSSKTGPQDPAPNTGAAPAVAEPSVGTGQPAEPGPTTSIQPAAPAAPAEKPAAPSYPSWPTPPAPPEEPWLTRTAKSVADAISGIHATSHAIWERDTILTGLSAAQSDAIADINDKVKATYGVELPDPTHGGYLDQAAKNIRDRVYQGGLSAVGANEPESVFGGGDRYRAAVQKEQFKLWDDARTALAAQHGASEATRDEAASVLQTDTPAAQLGAKYSHAANVAESQAWERGDFSTRAFMTAAGIGVSALNPRDPMTIPSLMVGGGIEPTMAKAFYPLARPALKVASDIAEQGVRQAIVNMGITLAEAPEHQAANEARGEEHGLQPALKDIGMSALYGFIPGALIGGVKALSRAWGSEAARTPVDEFIRQAYGQAPDEQLTNLIKEHFDAIHAWEEANGYEKGSSYSDAGLRDRGARERWGAPPEPPPAPGAPPEPPPARPRQETPRSAAAPGTPSGAPRELAPPLWEGKPYPPPPDVPDSARQRPSPSSITLAAIESAEADHAALPASIPGVPPSEIMRAYKEAIQHAESPDVMAPPEPPMTAPPRPDEGFLKPDHVPAPPARPTAGGAAQGGAAQGTVIIHHNGKPYTEGVRFDPRQLKTDAQKYQYKGGADASGVTERLKTVRRWDGMSAGNIVVHEHADGSRYVVDGHQRTGLANRIMDSDPTQKITQPGMLLKESDGWTVPEARTKAALKNIREGLGDTIDMARVLRDSPESWDDSLPIGRPDLKQAKGLANLSDAAWEMALNNVVPHDYASLVGNMVPDKTMHVAIMDDLARIEPRSQNQARFVISDALNAGLRAANEGKQLILEGFGPTERTLLMERSQVYDEASRLLRSDAKLFSMLDAQAGRIEEAGNVLVDTNADQATRAGQLAQALGKLAERAGPTSAALNRAAQTVADGVKPKTAARAFLTELPALLQQEGLKVPSAPTPPAYDVDTPQGRAEQTQDLEAEFMASQPGMFGPPVKTLDEQRAAIHADIKQKMLDADMPEVEAERNAEIVAARMATRAARMGRADPEQFYREQGWVVRGDRQREAEVAGVPVEGGKAFDQSIGKKLSALAEELAKTIVPDRLIALVERVMRRMGWGDWIPPAAISYKGKIYTGKMHTDALKKALKDFSAEELDNNLGESNFGMITRRGEFFTLSPYDHNLGDLLPSRTDQHVGPKSFDQPATVPTFYSAVERAVEGAKQAKASPEQWLAMVKNMPGVKPEEMKWLGLEDWLKGHKGPVTRAEVADYVRANSIEVREVEKSHTRVAEIDKRLTALNDTWSRQSDKVTALRRAVDVAFENGADVTGPQARLDEGLRTLQAMTDVIRRAEAIHLPEPPKFSSYVLPGGEPGTYQERLFTLPEKDRITKTPVKVTAGWGDTEGGDIGVETTGDTGADFRHSHWDEPNVVAHVRWDDRIIDGKRDLHIAEFQSDWAKAARKKGFRPSQAEIDAMPRARSWMDFMAEKGFTTEEAMQKWRMRAAREDVALHNEHLRESEGREMAWARAMGGVPEAPYVGSTDSWATLALKRMIRYAAENGYDMLSWDTGATNAARYPDGDRQKGAKGFEDLYDKQIPQIVSKLTKKFGGKVEEATLPAAGKLRSFVDTPDGQRLGPFDDDAYVDADDVAEGIPGSTVVRAQEPGKPVHSLTITHALKEAALNEGFPLFQASQSEPRGRVTIRDNSKVIDLFSKRNASTMMHEAHHIFLEEMAQDAADPNAPQQIKDDFQTILDELGAKDAESITEEQHEQWARWGEQYLRSGKAPSAALARAFAAFKEWLKAIYRSLRGLGKEIPDSIRGVMDRMIATDEEIAAHRGAPAGEPAPVEAAPAALKTGDPLVDHITADPYVASAIADPVINRKNDVPYGAGPNKANDRVVNVDRHVPKTDTIGGVKYEPARAVAVHEQVEKHALDQLMAAGVPETEAYQIAHFVFAEAAERAWVEANVGPNAWDKYQAKWDKWLKPIEHENPKNPPPDLYEKPYPHDDAHLAPTERGSDKAFEETGHANLPALRATAERVLGAQAVQGATAEGRVGDLEATVRGVAHEAAVAAAASPDPLDKQIGQILEREVAPLIDEAFPPATEAGPEGTQQTLMPGVEPVTGADRARVGAAAPLRGGNAPPPEGGLFDDLARAQRDLYDLIPTEDGLISSHDLETKVPLETMLAKLVADCRGE